MLYKAGRIKSIGVSNFLPHHLEPLMKSSASIMTVANVGDVIVSFIITFLVTASFPSYKKYHKAHSHGFVVLNKKIGVTGFEPATSTSRT